MLLQACGYRVSTQYLQTPYKPWRVKTRWGRPASRSVSPPYSATNAGCERARPRSTQRPDRAVAVASYCLKQEPAVAIGKSHVSPDQEGLQRSVEPHYHPFREIA